MILKILLIVWFFQKFQPIQVSLTTIALRNRTNKWIQLIYEFLTCPKCLGFWLGLIVTHSFYHSVIISICSILLYKITKND